MGNGFHIDKFIRQSRSIFSRQITKANFLVMWIGKGRNLCANEIGQRQTFRNTEFLHGVVKSQKPGGVSVHEGIFQLQQRTVVFTKAVQPIQRFSRWSLGCRFCCKFSQGNGIHIIALVRIPHRANSFLVCYNYISKRIFCKKLSKFSFSQHQKSICIFHNNGIETHAQANCRNLPPAATLRSCQNFQNSNTGGLHL